MQTSRLRGETIVYENPNRHPGEGRGLYALKNGISLPALDVHLQKAARIGPGLRRGDAKIGLDFLTQHPSLHGEGLT